MEDASFVQKRVAKTLVGLSCGDRRRHVLSITASQIDAAAVSRRLA